MIEFSRLLRVLEKELSYQEKLLQVLQKEREAIVVMDQKELLLLSDEKRILVEESTKLGLKRAELVSGFIEPEQAGAAHPTTLSKILEKCGDPALRRGLSRLGERLRDTVASVKKLNEGNGVLIKQALGFLATVVSIMSSQTGSSLPTYSPRGRLSGKSEDQGLLLSGRSLSRAI